MGKGSKLYGWQPGVGSWREIGDVGPAGVDKITRLAISPRQDCRRARRWRSSRSPRRSERPRRAISRLAAVQTPVVPIVSRWIADVPGTISLGQGVVSLRAAARK
jgi:hypothetical protein